MALSFFQTALLCLQSPAACRHRLVPSDLFVRSRPARQNKLRRGPAAGNLAWPVAGQQGQLGISGTCNCRGSGTEAAG